MSEKNVFDFIKSINEKTEYLYDEENEKNYAERVINTGLSFFPDTIFLVNEANKYNLTGQMHYDFLYHIVDKRKRFSKWYKKPLKVKDLENVMEYFYVNVEKAQEIMKVLNSEELKEIDERLKIGGTK